VPAARRRAFARTPLVPARAGLPDLTRLAPSARSIALGLAVLAAAAGAYVLARQTSLFAVQSIDVRGGTPALRAQVRQALDDLRGRSLLRVDGDAVATAVVPIPSLRTFTYDRAFPHTLRVTVTAERPVLVLRQVPGSAAYLVAGSGRVLRSLRHPRLSPLPRLWVTKSVRIDVGAELPAALAGAATALADLRGAALPGGVRVVSAGRSALTLVLGSGVEVRLGDAGDLRLKLAVARRILRLAGASAGSGSYLDVSVPGRPVLAQKAQVGG